MTSLKVAVTAASEAHGLDVSPYQGDDGATYVGGISRAGGAA